MLLTKAFQQGTGFPGHGSAQSPNLTNPCPDVHDTRRMPLTGVIVVDKPQGWTSHDVVAKARGLLRERSIGHLGTLDPMATGVLPLVIGKMTRLSQFYSDSVKAYEGLIRFGFATDTYDADGDQVGDVSEVKVTLEEVQATARFFVGKLQQVPPAFSAKKIAGVPAYKFARRRQSVELQPVPVEVFALEILGAGQPDLCAFRCRVSSGTYVRAIAHELGARLGCGAHLAALRRTAVAEFAIEQAHSLEEVAAAAAEEGIAALAVHPRLILPGIPSVTAGDEALSRIRTVVP